jgi:hypothetical protein
MRGGPAGLAAALVVGAACSPTGSGRMVVVPAPQDWRERLLQSRADKDRVFVEDPQSPLLPEDRAGFRGLEYWPPDPGLRFVGPIHPYEAPERVSLVTTSGKQRPGERYGWLSFVHDDQVLVLQIYRLLDAPPTDGAAALFLPFADETSGRETYPAGRYVDLEQLPDGRYVLDFNRAANPSCAYGAPERYACPVTPAANRLAVRIAAGERGYRRARGP